MLWLTLFLILLFLLFQKLIMGSFSSSIWLDLAIFSNSGKELIIFYMIVVVQLLSHVWLFATPWTAVHQALLPFTMSWNLLKLVSIESVMLSDHLTLCLPLLLPLIFPSVRVFSSELALLIRWPKYWSFSFSICPSNEYSGMISLKIDWFDLAV